MNNKRELTSGSEKTFCDAVNRDADLRIYTEFRYNEHIDTSSDDNDLISEVSEFHETVLIEKTWVAGIMTQRQPISLPDKFGPRPSMSFFLYNQNGEQAIARPYLDGLSSKDIHVPSSIDSHPDMPKYHLQTAWDTNTNVPSSNFVYDFEKFKYYVKDD